MAEQTGGKAASKASKALRTSKSKTAKKAAASALAQARGNDEQEGCEGCVEGDDG